MFDLILKPGYKQFVWETFERIFSAVVIYSRVL